MTYIFRATVQYTHNFTTKQLHSVYIYYIIPIHVSATYFGHLQGAKILIDVGHDILHKGGKTEFIALKILRHCPLILLLKINRRQNRAMRNEGKVMRKE
jgi:hypothetical protein